MKKIIATVLVLTLVFAFAACGGKDTDKPSADTNQQTNTDSKPSAAPKAEDPSVLDLCQLTSDDIKTSVGISLGNAVETPTQYVIPVFCADTSLESFENWVNALADNCRKASKDGNIYESEFAEEPQTSFSLDPEALINMVQFIYRTAGHVVYVTAADAGSVDNAFSCNIQVY